jgi:arylsulfatase A-like enzyme
MARPNGKQQIGKAGGALNPIRVAARKLKSTLPLVACQMAGPNGKQQIGKSGGALNPIRVAARKLKSTLPLVACQMASPNGKQQIGKAGGALNPIRVAARKLQLSIPSVASHDWHATSMIATALISLAIAGCASRSSEPVTVSQAPARAVAKWKGTRFKDCNLVFVSFDAMQASHVGVLRNARPVTPTIDAMAAEGCLFEQTYSVASWTVPASMTWFTGVYPSQHRMTNKYAQYSATVQHPANLQELSPDLITLAEVLKLEGYATGGFTGNAGVSGGFGYEAGFDVYYYEKGKFGGFDQSIPKALEWLQSNKDRKFFLFLHGYDCHGQNTPQEGFDYRYVDPGYDHRFTGSELEQETLREEGLEQGRLTLRDADVQFWRAVYDEKINRTDERFRKFLEEFDKLGLTDRTLFVLTSDHGTELYEHRRLDHGFTLYDEQLHVPLIVKLPKQAADAPAVTQRITDRVSSIDVMPTILDLLEIQHPRALSQMRGFSLASALQGERVQRNCYSETNYRDYTFKRSIITPDGWKLIATLESGDIELYNLTTDPAESSDLSKSESRRAAELKQQLFAHFKSIGSDLTTREWHRGLNPVYASQAKPR